MAKRKWRVFMADFETTVYEGQTSTEVWASAIVEFFTENVFIAHSIDETFDYFQNMRENIVCYYTNLKFDGSFWIDYLLIQKRFEQAVEKTGNGKLDITWVGNRQMPENSFKYSISDKGQWYTITIKKNRKIIELRDTLKLLPFSVKALGEAFDTKYRKLDMSYEGYRYAGCNISNEELQYIRNDVLVPKEAMEKMFQMGHDRLTIGSCCLAEFKELYEKDIYNALFPDLTKEPLLKNYGYDNIDAYIRKAYKGGWCYLNKKYANRVIGTGLTLDVNSLYPSVMHSISGSKYPVGYPKFWIGDIPKDALINDRYFFVRVKTRFYIKDKHLPFIQIKGSLYYRGNDALESSDVYLKKLGMYSPIIYTDEGKDQDTAVTLTLTCTDYYLFLEHYDTVDLKILDGCYFESAIGLFDEYINKYKEMKINAKNKVERTIAKLFQNNLYGKFATSDDSSFKFAYEKPDKSIGFYTVEEYGKKSGYIPIGAAITSYARNFTIREAQKHYDRFIYADTDSLHLWGKIEDFKDIKIDAKEYCCWKAETYWDKAIFVRQKTYIEHVTHNDGEKVDEYYNVVCAGMPDRCKDLFIKSLEGYEIREGDKYNEKEKEVINRRYKLTDFKVGLELPSKLLPKRIPGGVLLVDSTYKMRDIK